MQSIEACRGGGKRVGSRESAWIIRGFIGGLKIRPLQSFYPKNLVSRPRFSGLSQPRNFHT
jgi:hypothetical protein